MTIILGIETSCDETAASVVFDGHTIGSNVVASQVELHASYGGIFPEVASRAHIEKIATIAQTALNDARVVLPDIDAVAVTQGPGLPGSLVVGVNFAKGLILGHPRLALLAINHLEGHIYSLWLRNRVEASGETPTLQTPSGEIKLPAVVLIVSGGHTELLLMRDHGSYRRLGGTIDDAAGEAFDKVGRLLGLPYPGGPSIQKAAEQGNASAFDLPRVWLLGNHGEHNFDFSFSGLKTAVLRTLQKMDIEQGNRRLPIIEERLVSDLAASFQAAVVDVLIGKTVQAAKTFDACEILVVGGVSANRLLRDQFRTATTIPVRVPPLSLCTDNAAMIAAAADWHYRSGERANIGFDVRPNWPLNSVPVD